MTQEIRLTVNGADVMTEIWPGESLLYALRERLGLWGSKNACEQGECGSCSVIAGGKLVCACLVLAAAADGASITTIEGLNEDPVGRAVQEALLEVGGVQCGFCTPGFVVAITDLIRRVPEPDPMTVREALSGNLCRCTGYVRILEAVRRAAAAVRA